MDSELPMAIIESTNEYHLSFELPLESIENLFFLMKRPKDESFATFVSRFEKNISKRLHQVNFKYELHANDGVIKQNFLMDMKMFRVLLPNNILVIDGQKYRIQYHSPKIVKFTFPKRLFIGHYVLPKIVIENGLYQECQFSWFRRKYNFKKKIELSSWQKIEDSNYPLMLIPEDIDCQFKIEIEPRSFNKVGVRSIYFSTCPPEFLTCDFNYLKRIKHTQDVTPCDQFRIVSYNLLAEMYTDTKESKDMFAYCLKEYLEFSYRKAVLCNELLSYHSDVYILQEVDSSFYNSLTLTLKDFDSEYTSKNSIREGCAIFYRKNKFEKFDKCLRFTFRELLADNNHLKLVNALKTNPIVFEQLKTLPNAFMVTILKESKSNQIWLIANTHLYAGETADTIRFLQAYLCFHYLQTLKAQLGECHVVFAGDFNSTPDTCVLKIMKNSIQLSCFKEYSDQNFEFSLSLKLKNACGFPKYTNYTRNFVGCLDYIFFDDTTLIVKEVVPFPSHEDVVENEAIPSEKFPSDHIPLICTLQYNKQSIDN